MSGLGKTPLRYLTTHNKHRRATGEVDGLVVRDNKRTHYTLGYPFIEAPPKQWGLFEAPPRCLTWEEFQDYMPPARPISNTLIGYYHDDCPYGVMTRPEELQGWEDAQANARRHYFNAWAVNAAAKAEAGANGTNSFVAIGLTGAVFLVVITIFILVLLMRFQH